MITTNPFIISAATTIYNYMLEHADNSVKEDIQLFESVNNEEIKIKTMFRIKKAADQNE